MLNKKISGLYAITPDQAIDFDLIKQILIQYRPSLIQYRRKINDLAIKLDEATQLRQLCSEHNTLFIINDDINLAQKVQADGVHLGKQDCTIKQAKQQLGADAIIGVSCYGNLDLALQAQQQGASYVAFGALFKSSTKPDAPCCPLDVVTQAKERLNIPIVGIGGVNFNNQQQALNAGCDAVAMIDALFKQ
mgnify:FL=1